MLRSHHLCCMAIHIEETCQVRSFGDPGRCVPEVWRRCTLLYGDIALDSDALLCLVLGAAPLVDRKRHCNICGSMVSSRGLGCVCCGVLGPCGGPRVGIFV